MLASSHDILNLVIALCVIVISFLLSWAIYYLVASARKIHKLIKQIEDSVFKFEELIEIARNKLKNSSAYFMILGEVVKKALSFVENQKEKKTRSKKEKKKK